MHGATGYGGYQLGAPKVLVVRFEALCGDFGGENLDEAGSFQNCWAALAAKVANMQPKERNGTDRRRAPNVTYTAVWRT